MRRISLFAAAVSLALPLAASAQRPRPERAPSASAPERAAHRSADPGAADDCARARRAGRACTLDFEGDRVGGDRPAGDGELWTPPGKLTHTSLIRLRTSFRGEIVRAAERL